MNIPAHADEVVILSRAKNGLINLYTVLNSKVVELGSNINKSKSK